MKVSLLALSLACGLVLASPLQVHAESVDSTNNQPAQTFLVGEPLSDDEHVILQEYARVAQGEFEEVLIELDGWAKSEQLSKQDVVQHVSTLIAGQVDPSIPLDLPRGKFAHDGVSIPPGEVEGDMFRANGAINLFGGGITVTFGHVGIYDSSTQVIEAGLCGPPGIVAGVYRQSINEPCWRTPGISRAFVSGRIGHNRSMLINETALSRARQWADEQRPYNARFLKNKWNRGRPPRGSFNCSQLVWSAYLPYVDLDNDPGNDGVKPYDERVMPNELIRHRQVNFY